MNKNIIFISFVVVMSALAQLSLTFEVDGLQFTREGVGEGQWWRFITGNFVHLSWRHFAMNAVALVAIYVLYPNSLNAYGWVVVFVLSCLSVTIGIWVFSQNIHWYVGLSGALHGLLVTLIIVDYIVHKNWLNIILLFGVIAKLIWEGMMGPIPGSESTAGGPVVVQAHLYGFVGGLIISACMHTFNKKKKLTL
ncbi:MAG: rhombosortase [Gammaproteobacteria bacterium]|nr:MAG: rhombosortase [Gammaproteobacteria bacterium]